MIKAVRFCRAAFSFSLDRKGDVRGTAFKVKASRNCSSFLRNISLNSALSRRRLKPSALCASLELHPPLSAKGQRWISFPRKPIFWLDCFGRLYEKGLESGLQASLLSIFQALFLRALRAWTAAPSGLPLCCVVAPAGDAVSLRRNERKEERLCGGARGIRRTAGFQTI